MLQRCTPGILLLCRRRIEPTGRTYVRYGDVYRVRVCELLLGKRRKTRRVDTREKVGRIYHEPKRQEVLS
jgi:hypothetical protein